MTGSFAAQIGEWARAETERAEAVLQLSAQLVYEQIRTTYNEGGRLPIDQGDLRRSIVASATAMPAIEGGKEAFADQSQSSLEILGSMELGTVSFIGVTAAHGPRMEFGFVGTDSLGRTYNQQGFGYLAAAEQSWPQTVAKAEMQIRSRFEGGSSPQA
jgi:hypothetical protein